MKRTHALVAGLVAGASLAFAAATYAQPYGGMGHGPGPGAGMGYGHGPMAGQGPGAGVDRAARVESHLAYMKSQLQITPAQEAAWQAFATKSKEQAASMQAFHDQMQDSTANAAERMALHTAAMQQRAAAMAAKTDAFIALYAVLTDQQKAVADQSFGQMGGRGKHRGWRGG